MCVITVYKGRIKEENKMAENMLKAFTGSRY